LKVPTSAVSTYQNTDKWNKFNIIGGGILVNPVADNSKHGYTEGDGLYEKNETVTVVAIANNGYKFVNWTKNGVKVSDREIYTFAVTEDVELVANFEELVGIEQLQITNYELLVYPNPVLGIVTISATAEIQQLNIFDIAGKLVNSQSPTNRQATFDTGVLPKGIYLVQALLKDGRVQTGKVVVR
jgi:hypothetical protein